MKYGDVLQQFESLSESDADAALTAAGSDKRYKLELAGLFVACVLGAAAISFGITAFYRSIHPGIWFKSFLAIAALAGIWLSVVLLRLAVHWCYWHAVARHLKLNTNGA